MEPYCHLGDIVIRISVKSAKSMNMTVRCIFISILHYIKSVSWFVEDNNQWKISSKVPELPRPTAFHAAIVFNNQLWVVGGGYRFLSGNTVDIYDFAAGEWIVGPSTISSRSKGRLMIIRDQLYVVGNEYASI